MRRILFTIPFLLTALARPSTAHAKENRFGLDLRYGTSVQRLERQTNGPQTLSAITNTGSDAELWLSYQWESFRTYVMGGSRSYKYDLLSTATLDNDSASLTKAAFAFAFGSSQTEVLLGAYQDAYPYTEDVTASLVTVRQVSVVSPYLGFRFKNDKSRGGPRLALDPYVLFFGGGGMQQSTRGPVLSLGSSGKVVWGNRFLFGLYGGIGITEFQLNNNLYYSSTYAFGISLGTLL